MRKFCVVLLTYLRTLVGWALLCIECCLLFLPHHWPGMACSNTVGSGVRHMITLSHEVMFLTQQEENISDSKSHVSRKLFE